MNACPIDKTTAWFKKFGTQNPLYTHVFCNLTRISIGLSMIAFPQFKKIYLILFVLSMIVFFSMVISKPNTWKPYLRAVLSYMTVSTLVLMGKTDLAGLLVITDALMGAQARHMGTIRKCD